MLLRRSATELNADPGSVILLCPALCSIPIPHADKGIPAATAGDRRILIQFMPHAACTDGGGGRAHPKMGSSFSFVAVVT